MQYTVHVYDTNSQREYSLPVQNGQFAKGQSFFERIPAGRGRPHTDVQIVVDSVDELVASGFATISPRDLPLFEHHVRIRNGN